jgi:hypothetical protein
MGGSIPPIATMSKKVVYSTSIGNPYHGEVKPDTRRKHNQKKKKGKK